MVSSSKDGGILHRFYRKVHGDRLGQTLGTRSSGFKAFHLHCEPVFRQPDILPWNLTWNLKMMVSKFGISFSRDFFSGSMLNFRGVHHFFGYQNGTFNWSYLKFCRKPRLVWKKQHFFGGRIFLLHTPQKILLWEKSSMWKQIFTGKCLWSMSDMLHGTGILTYISKWIQGIHLVFFFFLSHEDLPFKGVKFQTLNGANFWRVFLGLIFSDPTGGFRLAV